MIMKIKILISFTSMHVHVYLHVFKSVWLHTEYYTMSIVCPSMYSTDYMYKNVQVPVSWSAYLCLNLIIPRLL